MPRKAREISNLDIYHVIARGINKSIIFEEEDDFSTFLSILEHYQKQEDFQIFAYCLMSNHVHLLLGNTKGNLGNIMRKIQVTFAKWYNAKYERQGYLFQDRFRSEPINDQDYFMRVFRYVHQNPLHAGVETKVGEYPWSSYGAYSENRIKWIDVKTPLSFFGNQDGLLHFLQTDTRELGMEEKPYSAYTDEETRELIVSFTSCKSLKEFCRLSVDSFEYYLFAFHHAGISVRQLGRLTGKTYRSICKSLEKQQRLMEEKEE